MSGTDCPLTNTQSATVCTYPVTSFPWNISSVSQGLTFRFNGRVNSGGNTGFNYRVYYVKARVAYQFDSSITDITPKSKVLFFLDIHLFLFIFILITDRTEW